jgi:hypothetical protein
VKDIQSLLELCDIDDPIFVLRMDANLADTRANPMQGLPVFWIESFLKAIDLVSGFPLSHSGKMLLKIFFRIPDPNDSLHREMISKPISKSMEPKW